jgi:hypothetical protein
MKPTINIAKQLVNIVKQFNDVTLINRPQYLTYCW